MGRARVQRDAVVQQVRTLFALGTIDGMTDGRLLERFTTSTDESAEAAFSALVERHGPMVLRVCRSVLRDRHDAEDAFQATFLVMVRRARSLWVRDSLGPWLYQVAHRTATRARTIETQRRNRERKAAVGLPTELQERPPDDLNEALHQEIARLPDRYRAAVVVCLLEGLPNDQAARRLGWPVGTVQSRLARGRERLKRSLSRRGLAPSIAVAAATSVSPRLAEATLQSALQYAPTGSQAVAISSSILVLTEGVLRMMTLAKLKTGLLAFATVGALGLATVAVPRTIGAAGQEPADASAPPTTAPKPIEPPAAPDAARAARDETKEQDRPAPTVHAPQFRVFPPPSDSTVQIRVEGKKPLTASGTVISSTSKETIVLTCASIFGPEPGGITIDLRGDENPQAGSPFAVSINPTPGELIDRDPIRNVALVRIRPGRALTASPIVPGNWRPRPSMTVNVMQGASESLIGKFVQSTIVDLLKGEGDHSDYEAIECNLLPKQIASGSGLFTQEGEGGGRGQGFLAGVCNSSDVEKGTGLYASPRMIHAILDRNGLSSLYDAEDPRISPAPAVDFSLRRLGPGADAPARPEAATSARPRRSEGTPKPRYDWSTTVRLKIGGNTPKQGLGTIIKSTPDEAIVLTSGSLFQFDENQARTAPPSVAVELLHTWIDHYAEPALVAGGRHHGVIETFPGTIVDVDPARNVALVRMTPGREGRTARIVPPGWTPGKGRKMVAWNIQEEHPSPQSTTIIQPRIESQRASRPIRYEAVECDVAPKQMAVGGGLFVQEEGLGKLGMAKYLAGVCNFASPDHDSGFYAAASMIYPILDKNGLADLYRTGNEALNPAPKPDFPMPAPVADVSAHATDGASDADRLRAVERRVDAIDGKIDEILRLLKKD